jgi:CRISPR-associated protein Csm1
MEFLELAATARGAPMLGVLKADADSLGTVIRSRLTRATDLKPLQSLSRDLDGFFGTELHEMMSAPNSNWSSIYTVFSGGDDLFLVGPWNVALDFAAHLRSAFAGRFREEGLTISAALAIIKPKFPIRLAAQQADDLLELAKTQPAGAAKDQFATLGSCWKWSDHARIINAGKQLANWVERGKADGGIIERGWLHTLLELALLQRRAANPRDPRIIPAMASSRLAYHVARNWPKDGPAREWINAVMKDFDRFTNTTDPINLHLPAIIRYAMLATRSSSDKE